MTSPAIWFDSTETGAPVINNANGAVVAALRAILVNGFNVKAISSISVASGVATVTCPGHGFSSAYGKWIKITGGSAAALSGVKQHTVVDGNTFTYPAPGVADGSYTATDARRAPLGWVESYANGGGTKAVFARSAAEALAQQLRIDDTATSPATTTSARTLMVRGATSEDAWTEQAPLESQLSGGMHCNKGTNNTTAKQWVAVGDDRGLWLFVGEAAAASLVLSVAFFDALPFRPGDAYASVISGTGTGASTSNSSSAILANGALTSAPSAFNTAVMKSSAGVGDPLAASGCGANANVGLGVANANLSADPDDFVIHRPVYLKDSAAGVRGEVPGLGQLLATQAVFSGVFTIVAAVDGSKWLAVRTTNFSNTGAAFFLLSEGWY